LLRKWSLKMNNFTWILLSSLVFLAPQSSLADDNNQQTSKVHRVTDYDSTEELSPEEMEEEERKKQEEEAQRAAEAQ
jgi:hypothetical protein